MRERVVGRFCGELAQLGERLVCNQEVTGSSPVFSTSPSWHRPLAEVVRRGPESPGSASSFDGYEKMIGFAVVTDCDAASGSELRGSGVGRGSRERPRRGSGLWPRMKTLFNN